MNVKRLKKIKYIVIALLSALLLTSVILFAVNVFGKRDKQPFSEKLVLNLRDGSAEEDEYTTSVTLQYAETFSCGHGEIETDEELEEHRAELKAYYKSRNEKIVKKLNLKDCNDVSYSFYGPYIEYRYNAADDFLLSDLSLVKKSDSPALEKVFVDEYRPEDCADRNNGSPSYSYLKALADVGLDVRYCRGRGIKIGVFDAGKPNSLVNLEGTTYEIMEGSGEDVHPFRVASVLGGTNGIADLAELYFASLGDFTFTECANWAIGEKGVNVINCSYGWRQAYYTATAAFTDYLVRETKVTFVASAGNDYGRAHILSPSTGLNVICVASNDADLAVSRFSSSGMEEGYDPVSLVNPTLTAPGGGLNGVRNVGFMLSGTSFSAPIVTGMVAILMQEFPRLKTHPEMVMAALTNTCNPAKGQTEIWDPDAGFGIVDYQRARKYCSEEFLWQLSTPPNTAQAGTDCQNIYVELPFGGTVTAKAFVLFNSMHSVDAPMQKVQYSDIEIAVRDFKTNEVIAKGETLSNFSYITFKNETYLTKSPQTEFTLSVYLKSDKTFTGEEHGAVNYYIEEAKEPFGLIYSDGQYFKDGETVHGSFQFEIFSAGFNIQLCYVKKLGGSSERYTPKTEIPVSSGDGKYEFYFTYDDNESPYTSEIFTIYLDTVTPVLTVETQVYGFGSKTTVLNKENCNTYTQYYTEFKILQLEGGGSCKVDVTKDGKKETYSSGNLPELDGGEYVIRVYNDIGNSYSFNLKVVGDAPEISFIPSDGNTFFYVRVVFEQEFVNATDFTVYRDGKMIWHYVPEFINYVYGIDGEYRVILKDNIGRTIENSFTFTKPKPVGTLSVADGTSTNESVSFTYGNDFTAEVLKDGEEFSFDTAGEINFTDDGKYSVKLYYTSDAKSYTEYSFEIDTVPPAYNISGIDENGVSTSPVVISEIEDDVTLEVFRNGALINYTAGESITAAGEYEVRLTDAAGNTSTCSFVIENTIPTPNPDPDNGDTPVWVIVFVVALVVAVGAATAITIVIFKKRRK